MDVIESKVMEYRFRTVEMQEDEIGLILFLINSFAKTHRFIDIKYKGMVISGSDILFQCNKIDNKKIEIQSDSRTFCYEAPEGDLKLKVYYDDKFIKKIIIKAEKRPKLVIS